MFRFILSLALLAGLTGCIVHEKETVKEKPRDAKIEVEVDRK